MAIVAMDVALRRAGGMITGAVLGLPVPPRRFLLVPLRDSLSFVMRMLSFLGRGVPWNDFRVDRDGKLLAVTEAEIILAPQTSPSRPG